MKKSILKISKFYRVTIVISLILCVLWICFINAEPFSDFEYYYKLAVNIASGGQWGNTYTTVGYSIVLGAIFKLFGASVMHAKIFNVVLTLANSIIFYDILNKINIKESDRKWIFAIFVLFPNNIYFNSILATEILFTTILLAATDVYFGSSKFKYILLGILTAAGAMVKPFFIVFAFAIFLIEIIKYRKLANSIKHSLIIFIVAMVCLSPWIYRNTKLIHEPTFISNNGGIVLYLNNNSQNTIGRWMSADNIVNSVLDTKEYKAANATLKNKMLSSAAKKWILNNPNKFLTLGAKRLYNTYFYGDDIFYSMYGSGLKEHTKYTMFSLTNNLKYFVYIFAIIFICIKSMFIIMNIIKRQSDTIDLFTLYSIILFYMFTSIYFITEGQGRYSFPLIFIFVYCFYNIFKIVMLKFTQLRLK
jgi:hypothetical protein